VNLSPGTTCLTLCCHNNGVGTSKLRDNIEDADRGKLMTVRDIITARLTVS
jgi:hypothetical protein